MKKEEATRDTELDELAVSIAGPVEPSAPPDEFDGPIKVIDRGKVTQSSLRYYQQLQRKLKDAEAAVKVQKAEISTLEKEFIKATEEGLVPLSGGDNLRLEVKISNRSYPKWKDHALTLAQQLGLNKDTYIEEVQAASVRVLKKVKVY